MPDKFIPLDHDQKEDLQNKLNDSLPIGYQDLKFCDVLQGGYPFYPDWAFIQIQKETELPAEAVSLFLKDDHVVWLDWQSETILDFNERAPLILSMHDAVKYAEFFFKYVSVRDGHMNIIHSYEDFKWREEPSGPVKKALSSLIRTPYLLSWDEAAGTYEIGAHILFNQNLFDCRLQINNKGEIDITERTLQVEDIPVLDDAA